MLLLLLIHRSLVMELIVHRMIILMELISIVALEIYFQLTGCKTLMQKIHKKKP